MESGFQTDLPSVHLARALACFPIDTEICYSVGIASLKDGDRKTAADHFQASLQSSPKRLNDIITISRKYYTTRELVRHVLPEDPNLLVQSMVMLFGTNQQPERVEVLARIIELVMEGKGKVDPFLVKSVWRKWNPYPYRPTIVYCSSNPFQKRSFRNLLFGWKLLSFSKKRAISPKLNWKLPRFYERTLVTLGPSNLPSF